MIFWPRNSIQATFSSLTLTVMSVKIATVSSLPYILVSEGEKVAYVERVEQDLFNLFQKKLSRIKSQRNIKSFKNYGLLTVL